jgi:drug/metabolite transporter (DMT)-like permease
MIAVLYGVFSATCWALLDLIARSQAARIGPFRMSLWTMVLGGLFLTLYFAAAGWPVLDRTGLIYGLLTGIAYGVGVGALFKAFSLGPISIIGPITEGYPALVILWGLIGGLKPTFLQWAALPIIFLGAFLVGRFAPTTGEANLVRPGDFRKILFFCGLCMLGYSAAMILTQYSAVVTGEIETTWLSRATAALVVLPFAFAESSRSTITSWQWLGLLAMAILDCIAVIAIASAGRLEGKEFAVVAGATYGAIGVGLAAVVLKERVAPLQWLGIGLIVAGVAALSVPSGFLKV